MNHDGISSHSRIGASPPLVESKSSPVKAKKNGRASPSKSQSSKHKRKRKGKRSVFQPGSVWASLEADGDTVLCDAPDEGEDEDDPFRPFTSALSNSQNTQQMAGRIGGTGAVLSRNETSTSRPPTSTGPSAYTLLLDEGDMELQRHLVAVEQAEEEAYREEQNDLQRAYDKSGVQYRHLKGIPMGTEGAGNGLANPLSDEIVESCDYLAMDVSDDSNSDSGDEQLGQSETKSTDRRVGEGPPARRQSYVSRMRGIAGTPPPAEAERKVPTPPPSRRQSAPQC